MPIKPELRHYYSGPAWEALQRRILKRALNACECSGECGLHRWRCGRLDRREDPPGKFVVLQLAHLNGTPGDDREENLKAMCGPCHLSMDREQHRRSEAATRREKLQNLELDL